MTAPATAGEALLADIIAHPDADDLRLIYADWLEEYGGEPERARFIRHDVSGEAEAARALFGSHSERWWPDVFTVRNPDAFDLGEYDSPRLRMHAHDADKPTALVERGFVAAVRCPLRAWLRVGPALARAEPLESAVPTDCRPGRATVRGGLVWTTGTGALASNVGPLWGFLPSNVLSHASPTDAWPRAHYGDEETARMELSCAAIDWARSIKCLRCNDAGRFVEGGNSGGVGGLWKACPECRPGVSCPFCSDQGYRHDDGQTRVCFCRAGVASRNIFGPHV